VSVRVCAVLDRVKMFLPEMARANEQLQRQIEGSGSESVVIDSTMLNDGESSDDEVSE
jgi:hypothetical protein